MLTTFFLSGAALAAGGILLSAALTGAARQLAPRVGLIDRPDAYRKIHKQPTPLLGGAAIYIAFMVISAIAWLVEPELFNGASGTPRFALLHLSAGLFFLVGLLDDKVALRPRTKLLLQILATLPFVLGGRSIDSIRVLGVDFDLGWLGASFTIFWLVACSNVVNLSDGLDGLAGTTGLIICLAIAAISTIAELPAAAVTSWIYASCLVGFLLHNWPPAKIFLGDSGSLQIGFVVGALAIESSSKTATSFALAIPLVLISIPVFDTTMAIVRRKLTGRSIGDADRGHIHHRLQDRGLSRLQALLALSSLSLIMAAVTCIAVWAQNEWLALLLCGGLLTLLIAGRVFGHLETLLLFRHLQAFSRILSDTAGVLRTRMFLARFQPDLAHPKSDHWAEVTEYLRKMGGLRLELVHWNDQTNEVLARLEWQRESATQDPSAALWQFTYSVPRSEQLRATVAASGRMRSELRGQRLIDLFRLFEALCHNWSTETIANRKSVAPVSAPDLLPIHLKLPNLLPEAAIPRHDRGGEERRAA